MTSSHTESGWRPIATAPRDRSVILLRKRSNVMAGCYYDTGDGYPWVVLDPHVTGCINAWQDNEHGPTHWREMPDFLSDEENVNV